MYNTLDEYQDTPDESLAFVAAATLAEMIYAIDAEFEKSLPENVFLRAAGLVDDDLNYVNKEGRKVDSEGNKINELGWYQDEDGNRVDKDGNALYDSGVFVPQVTYIDDETGEEVSVNLLDEAAEEEPEPEEPEETNETDS